MGIDAKSKKRMLDKLNGDYALISDRKGWKLSKKFVKGYGPHNAKIMIIGQAPGQNEDVEGKPFVGISGRMLNDLLEQAGIRRDDVYITSTVQFFPPRNRAPSKDEVKLCLPMLKKQIAIVDPKLVITLGSLASNSTIGLDNIMQNHGLLTHDGSRYYFSTLHPAAAVRIKKNVPIITEDFKHLKSVMKKIKINE